MKYKKYYVGLDIGTTKIVAMVGARNEYGKIQILGYGQAKSEGINKGVVNNIAQTSQSIMDAIQDAKEKTGLEYCCLMQMEASAGCGFQLSSRLSAL